MRYYAGCSDPDDDALTCRNNVFTAAVNPWHLEEGSTKTQKPFQAHPTHEKSRQGSAPPPYQPGSRKGSRGQPQHYQLCAKAYLESEAECRRSISTSDVLEKNMYMLKLCKAFLLFGVQAHRLEEYLQTTATYLELSADFQYVPHSVFVVLTNA